MTRPTKPRRTDGVDDRFESDGRAEPRRAEAGGGSVKREPQAVGAAGGGGEDRPLVVIGNNPAKSTSEWVAGPDQPDPDRVEPSLKRLLADRARALIAETCGHLPEANQIRTCGVNPTKGLVDVAVEHHPKGYAYTTGLQSCKSVWACPICSFKIRTKRAVEIAVAIAVHKAKGGSVMLLTLTTQHSFGESLDEVWDQVQECWSYITKHYRYTQLRKKLGLGVHPHHRSHARDQRLAPPPPRPAVLRRRD